MICRPSREDTRHAAAAVVGMHSLSSVAGRYAGASFELEDAAAASDLSNQTSFIVLVSHDYFVCIWRLMKPECYFLFPNFGHLEFSVAPAPKI